MRRSADLLAEAGCEPDRRRRFGLARLAALHTAWALCTGPLAERGGTAAGSPWALLAAVRPAFAEWALVFASYDRRWSLVRRAGTPPGERECDDLQREAVAFRRLALATLTRPPDSRSPAGRRPGSVA